MNNKELEIFELCERLAELLGDKEAIADLKRLYEKHPEMFKDMQEVSSTIKEVVEEPEIIVDATHSNKNIGIYKAAKRLDNKKMGDVVIKNASGTNEIFHANKKNIKEFERLRKQVETGGRDAHFLHPDLESAWAGSNEHSPATDIIPQKDRGLIKDEESLLQNIKLSQHELQNKLDRNLRNYEKVSDEKQKQAFLDKANNLVKEAKSYGVNLDSKSVQKLERANHLTKTNLSQRSNNE